MKIAGGNNSGVTTKRKEMKTWHPDMNYAHNGPDPFEQNKRKTSMEHDSLKVSGYFQLTRGRWRSLATPRTCLEQLQSNKYHITRKDSGMIGYNATGVRNCCNTRGHVVLALQLRPESSYMYICDPTSSIQSLKVVRKLCQTHLHGQLSFIDTIFHSKKIKKFITNFIFSLSLTRNTRKSIILERWPCLWKNLALFWQVSYFFFLKHTTLSLFEEPICKMKLDKNVTENLILWIADSNFLLVFQTHHTVTTSVAKHHEGHEFVHVQKAGQSSSK